METNSIDSNAFFFSLAKVSRVLFPLPWPSSRSRYKTGHPTLCTEENGKGCLHWKKQMITLHTWRSKLDWNLGHADSGWNDNRTALYNTVFINRRHCQINKPWTRVKKKNPWNVLLHFILPWIFSTLFSSIVSPFQSWIPNSWNHTRKYWSRYWPGTIVRRCYKR